MFYFFQLAPGLGSFVSALHNGYIRFRSGLLAIFLFSGSLRAASVLGFGGGTCNERQD